MEKDFEQMNYYEMLDLAPNPSAMEIRRAYNTALQMYQSDSLVSYSFFSKEERNKILSLLEQAYLTLINDVQRAEYDKGLSQQGILKASDDIAALKKPVNIFDINRQKFDVATWKKNKDVLRREIAQNQNIKGILSQQEIKGSDLKTIRNELGVAVEKIHQETKIRLDYLNCIERDETGKLPAPVFLKGFIKAYLKSLCIEPVEETSDRYMRSIPGQKLT